MSDTSNKANEPWFRHLWVWLVMIPPASAVVAGFATAWLAGGPPALVVDDYGEIAMATQQRQYRDQSARQLGLRAQIDFGPPGQAFASVAVTSSDRSYVVPTQLQLQLIHPTHEERDQLVILERLDGLYVAEIRLPDSRVYVQLEDLDGAWRLVGELPDSATALELVAPDPS